MTERQLKEIAFALVYEKFFNHGTAGHNSLLTLAELAKEQYTIAFKFDRDSYNSYSIELIDHVHGVTILELSALESK
jgi:hypothetical protein